MAVINRKELVKRHNPTLREADDLSPLTVGNGEFAFTADITGLQSLSSCYHVPLCTMSAWGWHTEPPFAGLQGERRRYTLNDVEMTRYEHEGRVYEYAVDCKDGNENVYNWLRHNPHRLNLARISFLWDGLEIPLNKITNIRQELDLYTGVLESAFTLFGETVRVSTVCAKSSDAVGFSVSSKALADGHLSVGVSFPYGSYRISASDWQNSNRHTTSILENGQERLLLERVLDDDRYYVLINKGVPRSVFKQTETHSFVIKNEGENDAELTFTVYFLPYLSENRENTYWDFERVLRDSRDGWEDFWQNGGIVDFSASKDPRAMELERRTVLSQYLSAVHSAGSYPPQETGLVCNSWYGKFHLEMHILHSGWFPLWGRGEYLEKSFGWYMGILDKAKANAARNGFSGARWPKMTGSEGTDSPSRIATLLIWQQPHIIYMLELTRMSLPENARMEFMYKYWPLIKETADFMSSFAKFNSQTRKYDLPPPLIPAQEEHTPDTVKNPVFELCYWEFGLELASVWAEALGRKCEAWRNVKENLAALPIIDNLYPAHQNCKDTFGAYNRDHPSMLYGYGFIPCDRIDKRIMSDTADRVMACWVQQTLWGWDFALCAMTYTRLNKPDKAIDALLADTPKNSYVTSGNNYQKGRDDLPLYLPGNGSLLLALAMMLAGYGNNRAMPGFPRNGMWNIKYEGISPLPY